MGILKVTGLIILSLIGISISIVILSSLVTLGIMLAIDISRYIGIRLIRQIPGANHVLIAHDMGELFEMNVRLGDVVIISSTNRAYINMTGRNESMDDWLDFPMKHVLS